MGCEGSFINISLRSPSLKSDVNTVLCPDNGYDERFFVDQFEAVAQSNDQVMADDNLQLHVSIARSRNGGV
ncbi:putative DNA polymerase-like protein, partial [Triplophysa rosa]